MPDRILAPPVYVEAEGLAEVEVLPLEAVVLTPPLPGATGTPLPAAIPPAPAVAVAVDWAGPEEAVPLPDPPDAAAAIAEMEESAEMTMGPEPAIEVTPLSADAILPAPTEEASEVVLEEPELADVADVDDVALLEDELVLAEQLRSYSGVVPPDAPTTPKLGLGVVGAASWSAYHQVLVLPKRGHPTWSQ